MTMGEMLEEIYKSLTTGVTHATKIGTLTGNGTINISSMYPSYKQFTIENFLVVITNIPDTRTKDTDGGNGVNYGRAAGAVPKKTYDASTGTLTVTGLSQAVYAWDKGGFVRASGTQTFTADIYAI